MQSETDFEFHVKADGIHLTWHTVEDLAKAVRREMQMYRPNRILALGKGALVPARLLAKEKTPVYYVGVSSYKGQEQEGISCYQQFADGVYVTSDNMLNDPGTLIVDDLWDTGQTFQWAMDRWPKAMTAALLSKKRKHQTSVNYVGLFLPTESWVIFPWE